MFLSLGVEVLLDVRGEPSRIGWQTDDFRILGEFIPELLHGNELIPGVAKILTIDDTYVSAFELTYEFGEQAYLELMAVDGFWNILPALFASDRIPPFVRDPGQIVHGYC